MGEPTMSLAEFRKRYAADDNEWWRLASGDHQNLFEDACDQLDEVWAERDRLAEALRDARTELDRWGWGDMHYGNTRRDPNVVAVLAHLDAVLAEYAGTPNNEDA